MALGQTRPLCLGADTLARMICRLAQLWVKHRLLNTCLLISYLFSSSIFPYIKIACHHWRTVLKWDIKSNEIIKKGSVIAQGNSWILLHLIFSWWQPYYLTEGDTVLAMKLSPPNPSWNEFSFLLPLRQKLLRSSRSLPTTTHGPYPLAFVNEDLWGHSHPHLFIHCLWQLLCYNGRVATETIWLTKPGIFSISVFTQKVCRLTCFTRSLPL